LAGVQDGLAGLALGRYPMNDHPTRKLGKLAPRIDHRTLRLAKYLPADLPPPPESVDWSSKAGADFGMALNDTLGCCTCSAMAHAVQVWSAANGSEITLPDAAVLTAYEQACGYDPADPSTDQGGVEIDVLNYFRKTGIGGYKIDAFAALDPGNETHIKQAINLFGLAYIGMALPASAEGKPAWSLPISGDQGDITPGSYGGHAVIVPAYDADGLTCITWGGRLRMTWDFWRTITDESYALISGPWAPTGQLAPSGFDFAALQADLGAVAS
jgi:hypothetical protein